MLCFQGTGTAVTTDVSTATTMIAADIVAITSTTRRCRSLCLTTTVVPAGELYTAVAPVTNASLCLEAVVSVTIMLVSKNVAHSCVGSKYSTSISTLFNQLFSSKVKHRSYFIENKGMSEYCCTDIPVL